MRTRFFVAGIAVVFFFILLWLRGPLTGVVWNIYARFSPERIAPQAVDEAFVAEREVLQAENKALKERLGRTVEGERVLAGVLLRPPAVPYDVLAIDAGVNAGIQPGSVVYAGGSVAIGIVSDVYDYSSRVLLYSAPGQTYDTMLLFADGTSQAVAIEGQGGGSLKADVPAALPVAVGDYAVLPGIGAAVVAKVVGVVSESGRSFVTAQFSLPVNMYTLRYVEVARPQ